MTDSIPLFDISWHREDLMNAIESITRGGYWAKGPYVDQFERKLESYLDIEHARVVNSGTTALVCALKGIGVEEADEVIIPSFSFIATANAVRLIGATPVFADIEAETYGLDPESVETAITDDTAAILPVHVYGQSYNTDAIGAIAATHDIPVIEDAAEALGATYNGQKVGTFGDAAALSFCQNKIVATGEGGAVVTDDDEIASTVELFRSHGRASTEYFDSVETGEYVSVGSNYRMADLVAALGCGQMENIGSLIAGRQRAASELTGRINEIPAIEPPTPVHGRHVYQIYTVTLDPTIDRDIVIETLADRKIAAKVNWNPIHTYDHYRPFVRDSTDLSTTKDIAARVLSLPMHPGLTVEEVDRIADGLREAFMST